MAAFFGAVKCFFLLPAINRVQQQKTSVAPGARGIADSKALAATQGKIRLITMDSPEPVADASTNIKWPRSAPRRCGRQRINKKINAGRPVES